MIYNIYLEIYCVFYGCNTLFYRKDCLMDNNYYDNPNEVGLSKEEFETSSDTKKRKLPSLSNLDFGSKI